MRWMREENDGLSPPANKKRPSTTRSYKQRTNEYIGFSEYKGRLRAHILLYEIVLSRETSETKGDEDVRRHSRDKCRKLER